jgi:hypothetical protein
MGRLLGAIAAHGTFNVLVGAGLCRDQLTGHWFGSRL